LFGALGVNAEEIISRVYNASVDDLWLYCFALAGFVNTGIIAALYVERFIRAAENAHEAHVIWWYKQYPHNLPPGSKGYSIKMTLNSDNPPLCGGPYPITSLRKGKRSDIVAKFMRQSRYPLVFVLAWLGFNYVVLIYLHLAKYNSGPFSIWAILPWGLALLLPVCILIIWFVVYWIQRKESEEYLNPLPTSDEQLDGLKGVESHTPSQTTPSDPGKR
jgi:hypothetical protein